MVNSKCEGDTSGDFQQKEHLGVHYSDVIKVPNEVVAREGKGLERDEDGVEHIKEETRSKMRRQRAPPFMSDGLLRESKSLLRKNAMHEEASDEDKAWLASLSDVEVELTKGSLFSKQEVALINNQLNMVDSKCEGDTSGDFQQKEHLGVHYSDVVKVTDEVVAREGKGLERDEDGVEHIKEETRSKMWRQRAPPFMSDGLLRESKSLLRKNAMHEEASDEDKAWLASLSDVEVDMLISIKKLAMERAKTIQDKRVEGIFTSRVLRTIGLLLKEFIRERLKDVHFPAQATDTLNIQPNDHENRFSPKVEEQNDSIIHGDDVGEVWKEMTAEQDRKRKRFSPKVEEQNDSIIHGDDVGEVWKEMTAEQDRKRKRHV